MYHKCTYWWHTVCILYVCILYIQTASELRCLFLIPAFPYRAKADRGPEIPSPPGYNPSAGQNYTETSKESDPNHLIIKKSWDLALGPMKQVIYLFFFFFTYYHTSISLSYTVCKYTYTVHNCIQNVSYRYM